MRLCKSLFAELAHVYPTVEGFCFLHASTKSRSFIYLANNFELQSILPDFRSCFKIAVLKSPIIIVV